MKIEMAQINTDPGDFEGNVKKILTSIERAKRDGAEIVVFPELTIPGYECMDLFTMPEFLRQNRHALYDVITGTSGITAIVGFVDYDEQTLTPDGSYLKYNAAAVIKDRELLDTVHKTLLPTYDVFDENRYFASAPNRHVTKLSGHTIGVLICEDAWDPNYLTKVADELVSGGAEVLISPNASPFYIDKLKIRMDLIRRKAKKLGVPFIYANLVGGHDGYEGEIIFDGQSIAMNSKGEVIGLGKAFEEDHILVDLDSSKVITPHEYESIAQLHDALILGIKSYFRRAGMSKAFIGLSGGIDSAVVASLAVAALGKGNVTGIGMPSEFSSDGSVADAKALAENLGIDFRVIPIKDIFNSYQSNFLEKEYPNREFDVADENLQARIRGNMLMDYSKRNNGLVISTGNKTEVALGYCTLYGDMSGGLSAIADVSKLKVYGLARYINEKTGRIIIPESTISKPPSAELRPNQTDEASLGIPYDILSPLVDEIVEAGQTYQELIKKYPKDVVQKVYRLVQQAEFKRRQAPPGIKVTPKAFGIGRRIPISHGYRG